MHTGGCTGSARVTIEFDAGKTRVRHTDRVRLTSPVWLTNPASFRAALGSAKTNMLFTLQLNATGSQWDYTKDVVVTGSGDCLEVFDRSAYDAYNQGVLTRVPQIAASLGHTS